MRHVEACVGGDEAVPVLPLLEAFHVGSAAGTHVCIVTPVMGGDLQDVVAGARELRARWGALTPEAREERSAAHVDGVRDALRDALRALRFLEAHGVAHADIKPDNVLLTRLPQALRKRMRDFQLRRKPAGSWPAGALVRVRERTRHRAGMRYAACVADFGNAYVLRGEGKGVGREARVLAHGRGELPCSPDVWGTVEYVPPEVLAGREFGCAGDVWALGCTAYELVAGGHLVEGLEGLDEQRPSGRRLLVPARQREVDAIHGEHGRAPRDLSLRLRGAPFLSRTEREGFAAFVRECLGTATRKRATAAECLQHPWLL